MRDFFENMSTQEILKQEVLYFLSPYDKDNDKDFKECLFRADKRDDETWDVYLLYCYDWIYEGHFSNKDLATDIKFSKILIECPQN